jgi:hypothetical protein
VVRHRLAELLVIIRFHALVRVSAISILAPPGKGPDRVRVFANPIGLDCESAASQPATQVLQLSQTDVEKGNQTALRYVLFSKVSSLALFFGHNFDGDEQTVIQRLAVYGQQVPNVRLVWLLTDGATTDTGLHTV